MSCSLLDGQKCHSNEFGSSTPKDSGIVPDLSPGLVPSSSGSIQPEDGLAAINQIEGSLEELRSKNTVRTEAIPLLKSIEKDIKSLGKILTAFVASEHQFRRQMCTDMTAIKELLGTEQSRSDKSLN